MILALIRSAPIVWSGAGKTVSLGALLPFVTLLINVYFANMHFISLHGLPVGFRGCSQPFLRASVIDADKPFLRMAASRAPFSFCHLTGKWVVLEYLKIPKQCPGLIAFQRTFWEKYISKGRTRGKAFNRRAVCLRKNWGMVFLNANYGNTPTSPRRCFDSTWSDRTAVQVRCEWAKES